MLFKKLFSKISTIYYINKPIKDFINSEYGKSGYFSLLQFVQEEIK